MRLTLDGQIRIDLDEVRPPLTRAQKRAMAVDREILLSAGAGAGKTHTLSIRFVSLLLTLVVRSLERGLDPPRVDAVLVLTFTEKAAEEMADRCYRRLLDLSGAARAQAPEIAAAWGQDFADGLAARVDTLVDRFDSARISTFHSFCARLLREYPAETGVPPGFSILEPLDEARIRLEVGEDALLAFSRDRPALTRSLLDTFGSRRWLAGALDQALRTRGALEPRLHFYARGAGPESLLRGLPVSPDDARRWLGATGRNVLEAIAQLTEGGGGAWAARHIAPLLPRLARPPDDPIQLFGLYAECLRVLVTERSRGGFNLRKLDHHTIMGPKGAWSDAVEYRHCRDDLRALAATCADWPSRLATAAGLPAPADATLLKSLAAFSELALSAIDRLRGQHKAQRAMDFTDLQLLAAAAVAREPALRRALWGRFRYLMVDEFQDTDETQWGLVKAIGRPDEGAPARDRIFLVGDIKQAIYGFRGGDVTVFNRAGLDLDVQPIVLPDNFRSRPELIDWFNAFFTTALGPPAPGRPPWEAFYEPLRARRQETGGTVRLITHAVFRSADSNRLEAEAAARLIGARILPGVGDYAGLGLLDRARHPAPPVAILLRSRTWLTLYEDALRRFGVPFTVARGVSFWARQEVMDVVNVLHGLATGDGISLVGALRSPLFAVPDQVVHDLARGAIGGLSLRRFARGRASPADLAAAPAPLAEAYARFQSLRRLRDRVPVYALLQRLLSGCQAWHAYALDDPTGQSAANVRRLVDIAARLEGRYVNAPGQAHFQRLTEILLSQVEARARESEATLPPSEARVVIMTVHAAKGLEFPVVVVPDLAAAVRGRPEPMAVQRMGGVWELAFSVPDADAPIQRRARPGRLTRLEQIRRREEAAEHRRLLYVATTRARDHLVLLGRVSDRMGRSARTWMELIEGHHGRPPRESDGLRLLPIDEALALQPKRLDAEAAGPTPTADAAARLAPVPDPAAAVIGAANLELFADCPARWYRRSFLGIPEPMAPDVARARAVDEAAAAVLRACLADLPPADPAPLWNARAASLALGASERERLLARLRRDLSRAAEDPALRAAVAAPGRAGMDFVLPGPTAHLGGRIERLWFDREAVAWRLMTTRSTGGRRDLEAAGRALSLELTAWAAGAAAALGEGPRVEGAEVIWLDVGERREVALDRGALDAALVAASALSALSWEAVEAQAIASGDRPCRACGFYGRGCRGR